MPESDDMTGSSSMNRHAIFVLAILTFKLFGFSAAAADNPRKEIEAANAVFAAAYGRGDAQAVAAMYTEHGELFPPNEKIVEGRSAIEQFWKSAMDAGTKCVQLKTSEVEGYGEAAVEAGTYTLAGVDGRLLDQGKYLVLWKRVDGKWRLHRDCWNSDMQIRK
jgi:ketosteroid isomerase-like protein